MMALGTFNGQIGADWPEQRTKARSTKPEWCSWWPIGARRLRLLLTRKGAKASNWKSSYAFFKE
jgi:hypothetical protein